MYGSERGCWTWYDESENPPTTSLDCETLGQEIARMTRDKTKADLRHTWVESSSVKG